MAKKYENVEKITGLLDEKQLGGLQKRLSSTERSLSDILKKLTALEVEKQERNAQEAAKKAEAEALLAGIMLDTKSFSMRAGVRTFEAAAYLKSRNADTIAVKKLFSECIEFYQHKNDLVSSAKMYRGMMIATSERDYADFRAAAAQAADDLLYLPDVEASFVITRLGAEWNISARSFGEGCNVSLIMEALGGGGHKTMAATQMRNATLDDVQEQLRVAIDEYYKRDNKSTDN